jgi:copper chaperone CopZ
MLQEEMIQVSGIRCERCVNRLALALDGHPGLAQAQANLVGQVLLAWDDDETSKDALVDRLSEAGFHEV